ncbi:MAG: hypothetical protein GYA24_06260 [Candidatus Lokiarchaeota archaeon]|nr:hypothetical protein [Candidatus Lokiarchaeota archaeon]
MPISAGLYIPFLAPFATPFTRSATFLSKHACRRIVDHVEDHDRFMRFDCPVHGPVLSYVDKRVLDPRGETTSVFKARDSAAAGLRQAIAGSTARRAAIASSGRLF